MVSRTETGMSTANVTQLHTMVVMEAVITSMVSPYGPGHADEVPTNTSQTMSSTLKTTMRACTTAQQNDWFEELWKATTEPYSLMV